MAPGETLSLKTISDLTIYLQGTSLLVHVCVSQANLYFIPFGLRAGNLFILSSTGKAQRNGLNLGNRSKLHWIKVAKSNLADTRKVVFIQLEVSVLIFMTLVKH